MRISCRVLFLFWEGIKHTKNDYQDVAEWWDKFAKPEIKNFCISFSIQRKTRRDHTKKFLLSYLKTVLTNKNWGEVARVKDTLKGMLLEDAMGIAVRSRFNNVAKDETASLYHAAREAKNSKNNLSSLRINGRIETDSSLIEKEVISFFNALFNGHHNVDLVDTYVPFAPNNNCLDELLEGLGALSDVDSEKLHEDISEQEIGKVIKECDNKAPGCDGLSYEFYKAVWPVIKVDFVQILRCQLERLH